MNDASPQAVHRKDYITPSHRILSVHLSFDLGEEESLVHCRTEYQRAGDAAELLLHGEDLSLRRIAIDGAELGDTAYELSRDGLRILEAPERFTLETTVAIKPQDNTELSGLYRSSGNFCTQCEAEGFRRITYFLDRPDVMTTYTTEITADKTRYPVLLSNGNRLETEDLPDGRHRVLWQDPFPKPSYLFALVAGDLHCHSGSYTTMSGREVRLEIWVEHQNADKCEHALRSLQKSMQWDEEAFGLEYDLDIYMIVAVNDFNMGAMENKGLNIFNSKYVLAKPETATDDDYEHIEGVIAHEYFHNWTGNRVTCRDWFQLTLKEGLTVFRDQQFTADMTSATVKRIDDVNILRMAQFPEDAGPMRHPIRPESYVVMDNFYTATVYNKGAEVIRMYHSLLGADGFRKGMDLYFQRHDGQAVTCDDFRAAMADANDKDLTQFENWYLQEGTPILDVSEDWNPDLKIYTLTLAQRGPSFLAGDYLPRHMPIKIGLLGADGRALTSSCGEHAADEHVVEMTDQVQVVAFTGLGDLDRKPVVSLLRDFSAPVELAFDRDDEELVFLMAHDDNAFNRWEAGQVYAEKLLLRLVADIQAGAAGSIPPTFVDAFARILDDEELDGALKAQALVLPTERVLAQKMGVIDPDAIHAARTRLRVHLAGQLRSAFTACYAANHTTDYVVSKEAIAARRLKNVCLMYLCADNQTDGLALAKTQFDRCDNMTDSQAALAALANSDSPDRANVLESFYSRWQDDPLVIDKWFSVQACVDRPTTVEEVIALTGHTAFTLGNPNRARSLLGAFAMANQAHFHRADGAGYALLGDKVLALAPKNPQLAARLVGAFNHWKRFDDERQALQKAQLERIRTSESCSKDVVEIVDRALAS